MAYIAKIELMWPSQKAQLTSHESDLGFESQKRVILCDNNILYDRNDPNNDVERAAIHVTRQGATYLKVTIRGLTESQTQGRLLVVTEKISSLGRSILGQWAPHELTEPGTAEIISRSDYQHCEEPTSDAFRGLFKWELHMTKDDDWSADREDPVSLGTTLLELYVLKYDLPTFFTTSDGVPKPDAVYKIPLLLLRMFLGAASEQQVETRAEWISLVTRICHGSAEPFSGKAKDTSTHWLKYDTFNGGVSFGVTAKGGSFKLNSWLAAYRNWVNKDKRVITCVNCYDQAAAVELALSIGMNSDQIAWEFHQVFGYISRDTELVGWGKCNNPYFYNDKGKMIVEDDDSSRWAFRNHAHLSWGPDFRPGKDFYTYNKDPKKYKDTQIFINDACAGPHVGNETREAYEGKLDNNSGDPEKYPKEKLDELEKKWSYISVWNEGLTGLSTGEKGASTLKGVEDANYRGDPIAWSDLEPSSDSPILTKVFGKSLSDIKESFCDIASDAQFGRAYNADQWIKVDIPDEEDEFGNFATEEKI